MIKPNGLFFNWEYIGPLEQQYIDDHLNIMKNVNSQLPERFQSPYPLRPQRNSLLDATKSNNLFKPIFERFFKIVFQRDLNGGVAYQILFNNIQEFEKNDEEARNVLKLLLDWDSKLTLDKNVPVLFLYVVGKPK